MRPPIGSRAGIAATTVARRFDQHDKPAAGMSCTCPAAKIVRIRYIRPQVHALLERAARLHQDGEFDRAVQEYKKAITADPKNGEALASLSKCLSDQGKHALADKAMAKAIRVHNTVLSQWSLF